jgi:1-phosphatidylinositol-3-phosphate 5-kinase
LFLQEHEYLRHVVNRIANLQPNLVLVHRNVSRLAQEFLLDRRVTLVLNVKASVLERVARCTQADIVTSVDAHIGRPQLGTCKSFYLKTFQDEKGVYLKVYVYIFACVRKFLKALQWLSKIVLG